MRNTVIKEHRRTCSVRPLMYGTPSSNVTATYVHTTNNHDSGNKPCTCSRPGLFSSDHMHGHHQAQAAYPSHSLLSRCSWEEPQAPQALTASAQAEIMHTDWTALLAGIQGQEAGSQERRAAFERLALAAAVQLRAHSVIGQHVARQCGLLRAVCVEVTGTAGAGCGAARSSTPSGSSGRSSSKGSSAAAQVRRLTESWVMTLHLNP